MSDRFRIAYCDASGDNADIMEDAFTTEDAAERCLASQYGCTPTNNPLVWCATATDGTDYHMRVIDTW
jgi:hypothetical protein